VGEEVGTNEVGRRIRRLANDSAGGKLAAIAVALRLTRKAAVLAIMSPT
jgi:hypothetical protein